LSAVKFKGEQMLQQNKSEDMESFIGMIQQCIGETQKNSVGFAARYVGRSWPGVDPFLVLQGV